MQDAVESGKATITGGYRKAISIRRKLPKIFNAQQASQTKSLHFCYHCGAVLSDEFQPGSKCVACDHVVQAVASTPPGYAVDIKHPSSANNYINLEKETARWIKKGFVVVRQTSDFVELRKPKRFSEKWAMAWLIAGIPFPGMALAYAGGYAVWHVVRNEKSILLFLSSDGTVRTEKGEG